MATEKKVLVCDIQRFSIHDGPGIRTTIFFKGCPLSCKWCHNPETIAFENQPVYNRADCIGCGDCVKACPESALSMKKFGVVTDHLKCRNCFTCMDVCPSLARRPAAKAYGADALCEEVLRDFDYYDDDGGVTLSGGEPLAHPSFLRGFLKKVKRSGLNVTVETSGYWSFQTSANVISLVDLFLFDLKVMDMNRHRELTGRSNRKILANLKRLVDQGCNVSVRMPLVPGLNDDPENLLQTARVLNDLRLRAVWLLPYHTLGEAKLKKMETRQKPLSLHVPSQQEIRGATTILESHGIAVNRA